MNLSKVTSKLRSKNISQYTLLSLCTILSIILVTSFSLIYFSDTIQSILPVGGDSRKQALLIFIIAIIGCGMFTTYASTLFFKGKSREYGIFLALGAPKSNLKKLLLKDVFSIISFSCIVGLILSIPVSFLIWKLFQLLIVDTKEMAYHFSFVGLLLGIVFCSFVILCIFFKGNKFINRSNIIEILQENRKTEVVKSVNPYLGFIGWCFIILGILLGYLVPQITVKLFKYLLPSIWNITYLFSLVGIYMVFYHSIVSTKKGKNASRYYKNIISTNMMRFSGKQTVNNMCVIAFLIAGALFASFYTPTVMTGAFTSIKNREFDNAFYYRQDQDVASSEEIKELAKKHNVYITNYFEVETLSLVTDGYMQDYDENNHLVEEYMERISTSEFISESAYNQLMGTKLQVKPSYYYSVVPTEYNDSESKLESNKDLSLITNIATELELKVTKQGIIKNNSFQFNSLSLYILNDSDYESLSRGLTPLEKNTFVMFNVKNPKATYAFSKELRDQIITRSNSNVAVNACYDSYQHLIADENNEYYWALDYSPTLDVNNSMLFTDWKYYPQFNIVNSQDLIKNMAVFLMLFIYMSIICLVSVIIISYTRGITIGINNKQLFLDLKRLGANDNYIIRTIKKQLFKLFMYPTLIGSTSILFLFFLIMYGNDGALSSSEILALQISIGIIAFVYSIMYAIYHLTLRKVKSIIL